MRDGVSFYGCPQIAMLIDEMGAGVETRGRSWCPFLFSYCILTPLLLAVRLKDVATASLLLHRGADINAKDDLGMTALLAAVYIKSEKLARLVVKWSDHNLVNATDDKGRSPLMIAAQRQHKLCHYLLKQGM